MNHMIFIMGSIKLPKCQPTGNTSGFPHRIVVGRLAQSAINFEVVSNQRVTAQDVIGKVVLMYTRSKTANSIIR